MAIAVADHSDNAQTETFTLHVCPNWDNGICHCDKDEQGHPVPGHPMYHFPSAPPAEGPQSELSVQDWVAWAEGYAVELETTARGGVAQGA